MMVGIGQTLIFAVLPPVAREIGLSELQVGSIFTVSAVLWMLMSPFWGRRSDLWGRRPMILLGLTGYAASMAGFAISLQISLGSGMGALASFLALIGVRAIFGLFGSAVLPAAQAYVADNTAPYERGNQLAMLNAAFALGTIIGPGVVAVTLFMGFIAPFYGGAVLGLVGVLAVARWIPVETSADRLQRLATKTRRLSPLDPRALPFLLVAVAVELAQTIALLAASFYAMDVLGMSAAASASAVGIMLMGEAIAVLFAQMILIRLFKPSPKTMLSLGALLAVSGFAGIVVSTSFIAMLAAMTLLGLAFGLLRPGMMTGSSLSVGKDEQGGIAGLMNATGGLATVTAPFVGMSLYQLQPQAPYLLCVVLSAAVMLAVATVPQLRIASASASTTPT